MSRPGCRSNLGHTNNELLACCAGGLLVAHSGSPNPARVTASTSIPNGWTGSQIDLAQFTFPSPRREQGDWMGVKFRFLCRDADTMMLPAEENASVMDWLSQRMVELGT